MNDDRTGGPGAHPEPRAPWRVRRPGRRLRLRGRAVAFGLGLVGLLLAGCAQRGLDTSGLDPPIASAQGLIGATPKALEASLGQPWQRRDDGDVEVWLYRSRTCRLDLFLYRPKRAAANVGPRVSSATPMPHGIRARSCLASLERRTTS